jgi:anti-sigma regulatory factor (Ser/Thr protein kinase)
MMTDARRAVRATRPSDLLMLERDTSAVATARRWVSDFLHQHHVNGQRLDDAVLIVSELVTNALRHGLGGIVLRAAFTPASEIRLAVIDAGDGTPELQPVDTERIGGLGLRIVDEIAADWGVTKFPGGTTVWAIVGPEA